MAGVVGVFGRNVSSARQDVSTALNSTVYSSKTNSTLLFDGNDLILGKSYFTFFPQEGLTATDDTVSVWIDGEIFNLSNSPAQRILESYQKGELNQLLHHVDGVFIVVIYDSRNRLIKVVSDRYGLKAFFVAQQNGKLFFAPELKCFPAFKDFTVIFRKDMIECFIDLGHLMGTDSWFEGVDFIDAASIYSFDLSGNTLSKERYWKWPDNPRNPKMSFDDAAEKMALLLKKAITSRAQGNLKLGVSLSGGLDSRAILASVYKDTSVLTYTFGLPDSPDVMTAKKVAKIAGMENRHFPINVPDWLQYRFESVWKTDGLLNMYHMHYSHIMPEVEKLIDLNMSGFSGDLVMGGSYLEKVYKMFFVKSFVNQRITPEIAEIYFGRHHSRSNLTDPYFDFPSVDPYLIYNRCRRFVVMGIEEPSKLIPQRMPFMDTELMEHAYSLPDEYRFGSKVYNKALLQLSPELFDKIPSASTGLTVSQKQTVFTQIKSQFNHYVDLMKTKMGKTVSFVDYHRWIKEPGTAKLIGELLDPKKALYPQFTDKNFDELYLKPHLKGPRFYTHKVLSALTIELWLQQLYNGRYRRMK